MALTTTVAGESSDSYISLADAETELAFRVAMGAEPAWDAASDANKELALKEAVKWLDRQAYDGYKSSSAQALRFPSHNMTDADGALYIPSRIKAAQVLLALALLENPQALDAGDSCADEVSIDGAWSIKGMGGGGLTSPGSLPGNVEELMQPYLKVFGPGRLRRWYGPTRSWV